MTDNVLSSYEEYSINDNSKVKIDRTPKKDDSGKIMPVGLLD